MSRQPFLTSQRTKFESQRLTSIHAIFLTGQLHTYSQTDRQRDTQREKQTDRQSVSQSVSQTVRQTDRQTDTREMNTGSLSFYQLNRKQKGYKEKKETRAPRLNHRLQNQGQPSSPPSLFNHAAHSRYTHSIAVLLAEAHGPE